MSVEAVSHFRPACALVTKFHISLNVSSLSKAIAFYRVLFDLEPAKSYSDYAKFELSDPPVILSLTPHPPAPNGGAMSHIGIRVPSHEFIETIKARLITSSIEVQCQEGATCAYRKQDKLHVKDPDGTQWEFYVVVDDVEPESVERSLDGGVLKNIAAEAASAPPTCSYEHFVTNPFPGSIPHADGALEEVRLVGTLNANLTDEQMRYMVQESKRVLKPGGRLVVHGLFGDKPFPGKQPELPGLAAMVSRVPEMARPAAEVLDAGFVGLQITRFSDKPWFTIDGVELREVKLLANAPNDAPGSRRVLYKGPFTSAKDDLGNIFERGKRTEISHGAWNQLRHSAAAEHFLFLDLNADEGCSTSQTL